MILNTYKEWPQVDVRSLVIATVNCDSFLHCAQTSPIVSSDELLFVFCLLWLFEICNSIFSAFSIPNFFFLHFLPNFSYMSGTIAAKLKFVLPTLRTLNERALSTELDKLSVICANLYWLCRRVPMLWSFTKILYIHWLGSYFYRMSLWILSRKIFYSCNQR